MTGQISQHDLDRLYKRLIADGAQVSKTPLDPRVPPIMFDSDESESRFLELLRKDKPNLTPIYDYP